MSDTLIQLIYASAAHKLLSEDELLDILEASRRNNEARDITGILLYKSGNFLQVLEGPEDAVNATYETIISDSRHHGVWPIATRPIAQREFPEWTMGFVDLASVNPDDVPGYSTIMNDPFDGQTFVERPSLAHHFIKVFKEHMR